MIHGRHLPPIRLAVVLAIFLAGCQSPSTAPSGDLYQQLGERTGIARIVEDLLFLIVEDDRINLAFKGIDVHQFHQHLTDQLCQLSGGPCTYTGRDMRELHADMKVTDTQFNALAENLVLAMEQNRVPTRAQNRLLARVVPLYPAIRDL
ncbi:group I truncated hemoglobin [Marinobacter sp. VGCF2001]|uniref:group I truncated hemoglobin n=1 Tax=Marinobacter sp. VGCF2001 TaxID=3417189 RepID=UPI003CFACDED